LSLQSPFVLAGNHAVKVVIAVLNCPAGIPPHMESAGNDFRDDAIRPSVVVLLAAASIGPWLADYRFLTTID
jgi:hypothetical protein